ncbi:hypothetical protein ACNF49_38880 [Actinomadura sp. ATCC 39365]
MSLGQLQHYFASRAAMLSFAMGFASEQTSLRVEQGLAELGDRPHPRDVLRLTLAEMLPLHADARATSRMSAAYVLEALHDEAVHEQARRGLVQGRGSGRAAGPPGDRRRAHPPGRDPATETNLLLALTGLTPARTGRDHPPGRPHRDRPAPGQAVHRAEPERVTEKPGERAGFCENGSWAAPRPETAEPRAELPGRVACGTLSG